MKASLKIASSIRSQLRETIQDTGGREVLAVGNLDSQGMVIALTVAARGNEGTVPALTPYMEQGDVVIHNHPSGILHPSGADLVVANRLGQDGIGFFIVDNLVEELYAVAEPILLEELLPLDIEELTKVLSPRGALAQQIAYEPRESQMDMLKEVSRGFNDGVFVAAEAGTGVGKSFAYLIPAVAWALQNKERIVLSTATINLQQQLMEKDLPKVLKAMGGKVKALLVKGRRNYLCLRRLSEALEDDSLFRDEEAQLSKIGGWAQETSTGTRTDLPFLPDEEVWSGVCSEADSCQALRCRHREKCFFIRTRREAASARILVANHHLLFSDLALRLSGTGFQATAVLPPFQRIIFDEAHNMEKSATSYFSEELSRPSLYRLLNRLYQKRRDRTRGVWINLRKLTAPDEKDAQLPGLLEEIHKGMDKLEALSVELLGGELTFRITPGVEDQVLSSLLLEPMKELQDLLHRLLSLLQGALEPLEEDDQEEGVVFEARMLFSRLAGAASVCESFREWRESPDKIFWISREKNRRGESYPLFVITPLDISGLMRDAIFEPYKTIICTSATMSVQENFKYWMGQVGLASVKDREVRTFIFPSPFPYDRNVLLGIPRDAPEPNHPEYADYLARQVVNVLTLSEGHGLVLFTSYSQLRMVYDQAALALRSAGIPVLRQGEDHRDRLLKEFNRVRSSVLFATSSFWEGVDAPGDSLQVVLICKLPFQVPSDPIISARREALERRGGNAFMEFFLPEAVMRLKQGFGRLMRRSSDRGTVIILDPRIVRKNYGSLFLESLPRTRRSIKPETALLADIESFLFEKPGE